jgi:hypothetical protein
MAKSTASNCSRPKCAMEPFRPFIIEFQSGRRILIGADSEILFPRKRAELVIAFTDDGLMHEFEARAIARLSEAA